MQPGRTTNTGGGTMEVKAAAPRCQLLLILLMSAVMLLPGTNGSLLLVQRTVTRTIVLQETIGKALSKDVFISRKQEGVREENDSSTMLLNGNQSHRNHRYGERKKCKKGGGEVSGKKETSWTHIELQNLGKCTLHLAWADSSLVELKASLVQCTSSTQQSVGHILNSPKREGRKMNHKPEDYTFCNEGDSNHSSHTVLTQPRYWQKQ
ncbi:hypothetical protein STEG23_001557, partial [Scotinomys teguina]